MSLHNRRFRIWVFVKLLLAAGAAGAYASDAAVERIAVISGRSTVLATDFDVTRIAVTNPEIADATVVQPREILIDGKVPGTISLIVWGKDNRRQYELLVQPGVTTLQQRLNTLFPGENIQVNSTDEAVVLSGSVSTNDVMLRVGEVAQASVPKAKVINMMQLPGGSASQQVMLEVRFAEVNRRAMMELGVSFFTGPAGSGDYIGRSSTQQFPAPGFEDLTRKEVGGQVVEQSGKITFSDFLNLFLFNTKHNIGAVVKALQTKGFIQSLAEPNLIAYNGREASFLAGGEIPVPVVQGISGAVSVLYKEFGVRLNFTPTIAGDTIRLKVRPEVSALDFTNGITLQGFRIPALVTRRADTEVELQDGQSFAIAGLMNNVSQDDKNQIPGLGNLPIIGWLFKSKAERAERTELLVLITPHLVKPLNPGQLPPLPTVNEKFLPRVDDRAPQRQEGAGPIDPPAKPERGSR